ncbi:alpha-L-rhamnosidase [Microbacterium sp. Bi98]|uniref:alpha-L-rhamnosidase n=1 Tax=Microbacterium sp. Bi98 TaxID=2821116 RepID=UPI001E42EA96|nr:alpha-L-rhamnosidase [Microbacterium sp. Bi98]
MTWHARMIAADLDHNGAPLLRREFSLDDEHGEVRSATLSLSALGVVEATLNGKPVSGDLLTPGWSSYEWRVRYSVSDVAELLKPTSVLGLALGNGWYRGTLGWAGSHAVYGGELAAFAELEIVYADGAVQRIVTDETWAAAEGPVLVNDLYNGETIDARRRDDAWMRPGFDVAEWGGVHEVDFDLDLLEPYIGPPISAQQELQPISVWTSPAGKTLVDFGQNFVGWIRVRVQGERGTQITIRHAEVLEANELGTRPLRSAEATDRFILSGGEDEFEPTFTFHGFRYAEIEGWPGVLDPSALTGVVIGSEMDRIGTFSCSDELLNRFHENVVWGMRGNFVDVPTDCPQRDERLGWTGDIAAFAPTAAFLYDVDPFLRDWLRDVAAEQTHQGGVIPFVVPDVLKYLPPVDGFVDVDATAFWSDAGVWVPWALWEAYGDDTVLTTQYESMATHVRRVRSRLSPSGLWDKGFQFGDWLDPDAPPENPYGAKAAPGVVATACAYRSADLMAKISLVLGRGDDAKEFRDLADQLHQAFNQHYVEQGRVHSDCTTVYALAIAFGLLDLADEQLAGNRLAELAEQSRYRISTGFAGTPFITEALSRTGHLDTAYRLLTERDCPSWLYAVEMGATTVWERWDSMLPDGTINPGEMTSFNHYAFGAVADWMHRVVGGLAPAAAGYEKVLIAPQPGGGITHAETTLATRHGRISVEWRIESDQLVVTCEIPDNIEAIVQLPGADEVTVGGGLHVVTAEFAAVDDWTKQDSTTP